VTGAVPAAFYAPLKSPNHPSPSGDRTMARLLFKALRAAGFAPTLASELRTLDLAGDAGRQEEIRARAQAEAERLIRAYRGLPETERPRLWFTYHVYYKAPDWIGPRVADGLGIPYAVAEGSRARKRASGPWALGHSGAEAALDRADVLFAMTAADRDALERDRRPGQTLVDLPPFLDGEEWMEPPPAREDPGSRGEDPAPPSGAPVPPPAEGRGGAPEPGGVVRDAHPARRGRGLAGGGHPTRPSPEGSEGTAASGLSRPSPRPAPPEGRLLTVAMMRRGDKLASYRVLADALGQLGDRPWSLTVVGDGEARDAVHALFAPFGPRVAFAGQVGREGLAALYREAGLLLWPAVNEAYGMVLLEAQALGCPVVAGAYGGVASVVQDGRTGLLTPPGDAVAFAAAVRDLLDDPERIARFSGAAARFVREERSLAVAARGLRAGLEPVLAGGRA
jgi:glycosyltransferase involved in cell wall biosynthesis